MTHPQRRIRVTISGTYPVPADSPGAVADDPDSGRQEAAAAEADYRAGRVSLADVAARLGADETDGVSVEFGAAQITMSPHEMRLLLSAAADEIFRLRRALAYEAGGRAEDLSYKSFPKSRRSLAEQSVRRMQAAARGEARIAYAGTSDQVLRYAMREAGADELLTNHALEVELGMRRADSTVRRPRRDR